MPDMFCRRHESPCICGRRCLGPLAFYTGATGAMVSLSLGARRAERLGNTFRDGLVFISRPVKIGERVCLRVERTTSHWHGALRVGFTAMQPTCRSLPSFAIPTLTDTPGYWAGIVPEEYCPPGSELQFWVTPRGKLKLKVPAGQKTLLQGVDVTRLLWAMIDVYGQTCAVLLLGSEKKDFFRVRTSCPHSAPTPVSLRDRFSFVSNNSIHSSCSTLTLPALGPSVDDSDNEQTAGSSESCVVCLCEKSRVTLSCGHHCLCLNCTNRILAMFGTCPLCRAPILDLLGGRH